MTISQIGLACLLWALPIFAQRTLALKTDTTLAAVGDWAGGKCIDRGIEVECRLKLQIRRVLKGNAPPGTTVAAHWRFPSRQDRTREQNEQLDSPTVLIFLKSGGGSEFEAIPFESPYMGGYFVPASPSELSTPLNYPPNASFDRKVASERAWGVLRAAAGIPVSPGASLPGSGGRTFYVKAGTGADVFQHQLLETLICGIGVDLPALNAREIESVLQALIASGDPRLRMIGFSNLLRTGNVDVLLEFEQALPGLDSGFWGSGSLGLAEMDLHSRPDGVDALLRIVTSDWKPFGMETAAVTQFSRNHTAKALPWLLEGMASSPSVYDRQSARDAICGIAAARQPRLRVDEEFVGACGLRTASSSRVGSHGGNDGGDLTPPPKPPEILAAWIRSHAAVWTALAGRAPSSAFLAGNPPSSSAGMPSSSQPPSGKPGPTWTLPRLLGMFMPDPEHDGHPAHVLSQLHDRFGMAGIRDLSATEERTISEMLYAFNQREAAIERETQQRIGQDRLRGVMPTAETYRTMRSDRRQRVEAFASRMKATLSTATWEKLHIRETELQSPRDLEPVE